MALQVTLPTFHTGQMEAFKKRTRYQALCCGRRWGKTDYFKILAGDRVAKGQNVGIFVPNYKIQQEVYAELEETLEPIKKSSSKADWIQRFKTGGRIDFWTLENERAGRSRKYHLAIIDEAAFTKDSTMMRIWDTCIEPTLLDYEGQAVVGSTPNGINEENFFYQICHKPELNFSVHHAPTSNNPYMPFPKPNETRVQWLARREEEFRKLKERNHPLVFKQEYLAEFVDWSGVAFFELEKMLSGGQGLVPPKNCDYVFAVIDTATKDGAEHDGTAVTYFAKNTYGAGAPLTILDWDIVQIQGAMLETWLPSVFQNLAYWEKELTVRYPSTPVWIEDKAAGSVLIQQAQNRGWNAHAIDGKLTSLGKDARAINVSGNVYRGEVKLSQRAYEKTKMYKGFEKNHFISQVCGYVVGDKNAATRADDLLDTFTYGIATALGNSDGF